MVVARLCAASPPIAVTARRFVGVIITAVLTILGKNRVGMAPGTPRIGTFITAFGSGGGIGIELARPREIAVANID